MHFEQEGAADAVLSPRSFVTAARCSPGPLCRIPERESGEQLYSGEYWPEDGVLWGLTPQGVLRRELSPPITQFIHHIGVHARCHSEVAHGTIRVLRGPSVILTFWPKVNCPPLYVMSWITFQ